VGGVAGAVLPTLSFTSVTEKLLPASITSNQFIRSLVHPTAASPLAYGGIHRPRIPANTTNEWGSMYAVSLPFAIAAMSILKSKLWKNALLLTIILSAAPLVFSSNRGAWLAVGVAVVYAVARLSVTTGPAGRTGRAMVVGLVVVAAVVLLSPLYTLIYTRLFVTDYSNQGRIQEAQLALNYVKQSPLVGYATPFIAPEQVGHQQPPIGGTGQMWELLVSQGVPGFILYSSWFVYVLLKTVRRPRRSGGNLAIMRFWPHVAILAGLVQFPFYELLPWGLPVMMVAAALALRAVPYERRAAALAAARARTQRIRRPAVPALGA